jgi:hypothetical protein
MLGALAAACALSQPAYHVDLFVVANNHTPIKDLEWLDKGRPESPIERTLYPSLQALAKLSKPFLLVDGGNTAPFLADPKALLLVRDYESYDSMTQDTVVNGRAHHEVLERTFSTSTSTYTLAPLAYNSRRSYQNISYSHFKHPKPWFLAFQDLNSYRTGMNENWRTNTTWEDEKLRGQRTISLNYDSVRSTGEHLVRDMPSFAGIVICAWGRPLSAYPRVVSMPSPGVVAHYRVSVEGTGLEVELVQYLRERRPAP